MRQRCRGISGKSYMIEEQEKAHTNLAFLHSLPSQLSICSSHSFHHKGCSHIAGERNSIGTSNSPELSQKGDEQLFPSICKSKQTKTYPSPAPHTRCIVDTGFHLCLLLSPVLQMKVPNRQQNAVKYAFRCKKTL